MYCSKCGSTITEGTTFCTKCGQSTYAAPVVAANSAPLAAAPFAAPIDASQAAPAGGYAGFWLRFLAHIIDSIILGIFSVPILVGAAMVMGLGAAIASMPRHGDPFAEGFPPVLAGFIAIVVLVGILGGWLYYALLESSEWQATAGKRVLGLAVTDLTGDRITFGRASGRHFGKIITGLIPLGIGFILAGVTEKKQALHDMIAGCLVLRKS